MYIYIHVIYVYIHKATYLAHAWFRTDVTIARCQIAFFSCSGRKETSWGMAVGRETPSKPGGVPVAADRTMPTPSRVQGCKRESRNAQGLNLGIQRVQSRQYFYI